MNTPEEKQAFEEAKRALWRTPEYDAFMATRAAYYRTAEHRAFRDAEAKLHGKYPYAST